MVDFVFKLCLSCLLPHWCPPKRKHLPMLLYGASVVVYGHCWYGVLFSLGVLV